MTKCKYCGSSSFGSGCPTAQQKSMNILAMKRNANIAIRPAMALAVLIAPQKNIGMVAALINVVGVARLQ